MHPGTVITLPMAAASQWPAVRKAMAGNGPPPKPAGPVIAVRVAGIVAAENEFPSGGTPTYDLYPTTAFAAATRGTPALPSYYVRLRHGPADLAKFEAAAIGIRYALDPGRGTRAVPVRTALTGSVAAVAAVCATAVFGASLAHLTATPALYGAPFQMYVNYSGPGGTYETNLLTKLGGDRAIDQITLASVPEITVGHVNVRATAASSRRGPLLLSAVQGAAAGRRRPDSARRLYPAQHRSADRRPGPGDRDPRFRWRTAHPFVPGGGGAGVPR